MKRIVLTACLVLFTLTSCGLAPDPRGTLPPARKSTPTPTRPTPTPTAEPVEPVFNLRYSDEPTKTKNSLNLDIYPTVGAELPVMIFVHGGNWSRGNKLPVDAKPAAFNAHGWVFVSVNYRLIAEVDLTQQVQDVARSIGWVKKNIAQYGGDPSRLFLMGHSAGAHLVSLIGTDETYLRGEGLSLSDIRGIVSLDTQAYDMFGLMSNLAPRGGQVYRDAFGADPDFWKKMSPQMHVEAGKNIPPFVVVYASEKEGRVSSSRQFYESLQKADVPAILLPAQKATHGDVNSNFGLPNDYVSGFVFDWLAELAR